MGNEYILPEQFSFPSPVLKLEGKGGHPYIPLPEDTVSKLREQGVRRVVGSLNGKPFDRAIQRWKTTPCLIFGRDALRKLGARVGDIVLIELRPHPHPDRVLLCAEFEAALKQDPDAQARFNTMTAGRQRSLNYYVDSARRDQTRIKRALEITYKLRTHTLSGDDQFKPAR